MRAPEIRLVDDPSEIARAAVLFGEIWPDEQPARYAVDLLRAIVYAGGYLAGTYAIDGDDDVLIGASLGFLGRHDGELVLHSHATGVRPGTEHHGLGFALKQHQRSWARAHGLTAITWTFDPLVRRNAWFNLGKLGARVVGYVDDFYGPQTDAINRGDETDRAVVRWSTDPDEVPGTPRNGSVILAADGVVHEPPASADVLVAHTPPDVIALRATDPAAARRWRHAMRESFGTAIRAGWTATAFTRDGRYTLEQCTDRRAPEAATT